MKFPEDPGFKYFDEEEKELIEEIESQADTLKPISLKKKKELLSKLKTVEIKKQLTFRLNGGDIEAVKFVLESLK